MTALRDASELLWPAVSETIASLDLKPEDAAAKKVAQRLAQVIDDTTDQKWAMRWLAPELLKVLAELGATPAARAALTKGAKGGQDKAKPKSQLEIMRENRAKRRA